MSTRRQNYVFVHVGLGIYLLKSGTVPLDEDLACAGRDTIDPTYLVGLASEREVWVISCSYENFLPQIEILREPQSGLISAVFHDPIYPSNPGQLLPRKLLQFSRKVRVLNQEGLKVLLTELGRRLLIKQGRIENDQTSQVALTSFSAEMSRAMRYIDDLAWMSLDMEYMDSIDSPPNLPKERDLLLLSK
jgi:hypothetical protein